MCMLSSPDIAPLSSTDTTQVIAACSTLSLHMNYLNTCATNYGCPDADEVSKLPDGCRAFLESVPKLDVPESIKAQAKDALAGRIPGAKRSTGGKKGGKGKKKGKAANPPAAGEPLPNIPGAMPYHIPGAMPYQVPGAMPHHQVPGAMPYVPGAMPPENGAYPYIPGAMPPGEGQYPPVYSIPGAAPPIYPPHVPGAAPPHAGAPGYPPLRHAHVEVPQVSPTAYKAAVITPGPVKDPWNRTDLHPAAFPPPDFASEEPGFLEEPILFSLRMTVWFLVLGIMLVKLVEKLF
ncbi:hypothetical protein HK101_003827 [Irineochytrium annulatum]|nr:hypothetical protein HK101_003827 [Irineochytrium annulatum]